MEKKVLGLALLYIYCVESFGAMPNVFFPDPGCYKVKGLYEGFSYSHVLVRVMPSTRSEHIVKIKTDVNHKLSKGARITTLLRVFRRGWVAEQQFESKKFQVEVVPRSVSLAANAWSLVSDKRAEKCELF